MNKTELDNAPAPRSVDQQQACSAWVSVSHPPQERIRVIAADAISVIGVCFFGHASAPTLWNDAASQRCQVECWETKIWRYSRDECRCPLPTHWQPLPPLPNDEPSRRDGGKDAAT